MKLRLTAVPALLLSLVLQPAGPASSQPAPAPPTAAAPAPPAEPGSLPPAEGFAPADLQAWARNFGTPLYVYDGDRVAANYRRVAAAFTAIYPATRLHYALKANSNPAIVRILRQLGVAQRACGRAAESEATLRRSLALFEEMGIVGEAMLLRGELATGAGQPA